MSVTNSETVFDKSDGPRITPAEVESGPRWTCRPLQAAIGDPEHSIDLLRRAAAQSCQAALRNLRELSSIPNAGLVTVSAPHSWMALAVLAESGIECSGIATPVELSKDEPFDMANGRIHDVLEAIGALSSSGSVVIPCAVPKEMQIVAIGKMLLCGTGAPSRRVFLLSETDTFPGLDASTDALTVVDLAHQAESFLVAFLEGWVELARSDALDFVRQRRQPGRGETLEKSTKDLLNEWLEYRAEDVKEEVAQSQAPELDAEVKGKLAKLVRDRDRPAMIAALFVASHVPKLEVGLFHQIVAAITPKDDVDHSLMDRKERRSIRKRSYELDDPSRVECGIRVVTRDGLRGVELPRVRVRGEPPWTIFEVKSFMETEVPMQRVRLTRSLQSLYWLAMAMDPSSTRALVQWGALLIRDARRTSKADFKVLVQTVAWGLPGRPAWDAEGSVAKQGNEGLRRAADRWNMLVDVVAQDAPELRNECVLAILEGGCTDVPPERHFLQSSLKARLLLQRFEPGAAELELNEVTHLRGLEPEDLSVQGCVLHLATSSFFDQPKGDDSVRLEERLRPGHLAALVAAAAVRFDGLAPGFREAFLSLGCVALLHAVALNRDWRVARSGVVALGPAVEQGRAVLDALCRSLPPLLDHDGGAEGGTRLSPRGALLHAWVLSDLAVGSLAWGDSNGAAFEAFMGNGAKLIYREPVTLGVQQPVSFFDQMLWVKERHREGGDAEAMKPFLSLCDRLYCALPLYVAMLLSLSTEDGEEGPTFVVAAAVKNWLTGFTSPALPPQRLQATLLADSMKDLGAYVEAWQAALTQAQDRRLLANLESAKTRFRERLNALREFGRVLREVPMRASAAPEEAQHRAPPTRGARSLSHLYRPQPGQFQLHFTDLPRHLSQGTHGVDMHGLDLLHGPLDGSHRFRSSAHRLRQLLQRRIQSLGKRFPERRGRKLRE